METSNAPSTQGIATPLLRLFDQFSDFLNALGTLLIGTLTLLVCADVASRGLFNQPIRGVPELAAMAIVAIVYLQIPSALKAGRWTMSDMLLVKLPPRPRQFAEASFNALGSVLFVAICVAVGPYVTDAYQSGDYVGVPGMFTFPTWPIKSLVLLGSAMCAVQFGRYATAHLLNAIHGEAK